MEHALCLKMLEGLIKCY